MRRDGLKSLAEEKIDDTTAVHDGSHVFTARPGPSQIETKIPRVSWFLGQILGNVWISNILLLFPFLEVFSLGLPSTVSTVISSSSLQTLTSHNILLTYKLFPTASVV
jgi:hypothetical protein